MLARREIIGYLWIVVSIIALAFLSFGLWVHHMFTVGIPHLALAFFSSASTAVAVPTAVQIFAWIGTLLAGRPQLKLPMLYLLGFFSVFVMGGLTGVMLAVVPFNWQVHDTHFVVAHLHYVLVGGFIFPMLAAAYYWLPLFTGRAPRLSLGVTAFWLIFVGFNLTFLIMHVTGLMGMPRRIYTYEPGVGWAWLNLVSSIGSFLMAIGFALFTIDIVLQSLFGKRSARNPWGAGTLEWATAMPPPTYNFASLPAVSDRSPLKTDPGLPVQLARGDRLSRLRPRRPARDARRRPDVRPDRTDRAAAGIDLSAADQRARDRTVLRVGSSEILSAGARRRRCGRGHVSLLDPQLRRYRRPRIGVRRTRRTGDLLDRIP